jgi:hypothetical protein
MQRFWEWQVMNSNSSGANTSSTTSSTSSSGPKDRIKKFKKLIEYARTHVAPAAVKTEVILLTSYHVHYKEYFEKNGTEWTSSIIVRASRFDDTWGIQSFIDDHLEDAQTGEGFENLIAALGFYINTPSPGTPEYDDILTESVDISDELKIYNTLWD